MLNCWLLESLLFWVVINSTGFILFLIIIYEYCKEVCKDVDGSGILVLFGLTSHRMKLVSFCLLCLNSVKLRY